MRSVGQSDLGPERGSAARWLGRTGQAVHALGASFLPLPGTTAGHALQAQCVKSEKDGERECPEAGVELVVSN